MDSGVVEPSSLCDYCRPVFSLDRSLGRTIPYGRKDLHPDYPALKISIAAGCEACPLLRYALQQNINIKQLRKAHSVESSVDRVIIKEIDKTFYPPSLADVRANWTLSKLHVLVLWQERIDVDIWLHVYADEDSLTFRSNLIRNTLPDPEPLCRRNLQNLDQLINDCLKHHTDCEMTFAEAYLPTRLIDAGPSDVGSVRLVNSKELPRSAPYAALSHVWGTRPFLSTTSATLRDRERCIALSDMPANFRDAILFIRALGLQYIWIDSLCIVQDDKDDWKNESQKMGNVYSSAYITVVPVSTVSAHDGFLHRRQLVNRPVKITHTTVGSKPEFDHFYVDLPPITYIMKTHDIQNSVWNSRGWTFQERLLSKRLLYFTAYQLYFECQGSCWMENNTPPDLLRMIGNQPWVGVNTILAQVSSDLQGTIPDEWYLDWVEQYTQRQLTKPSDRLPALEGLARVISVPVSDLYIHGLWANDLARGLLWRLKNNSSSKIVAEIHTPTWTWARWQGAIRHETFFDLDGHVETVSCFKLLSTTNSEDEDSHKQPHCILAIEGKLAPMDKIIGDGTYPCRGGHSTHVWLDDVSTVKEGGKMFTFLVGRTATFEYEGDQPTSMTPHCLLLKAVVGKSNRYRRVGIMQLPDSKAKSLEDESEDVGLRDGDGDGEHKFLDEEHIFKDSLLQIFELE